MLLPLQIDNFFVELFYLTKLYTVED